MKPPATQILHPRTAPPPVPVAKPAAPAVKKVNPGRARPVIVCPLCQHTHWYERREIKLGWLLFGLLLLWFIGLPVLWYGGIFSLSFGSENGWVVGASIMLITLALFYPIWRVLRVRRTFRQCRQCGYRYDI
jgi:hypothetical protein